MAGVPDGGSKVTASNTDILPNTVHILYDKVQAPGVNYNFYKFSKLLDYFFQRC